MKSHDPAPSRWRYRLQRWMLTPTVRIALRAGVPFALVFIGTSAYLADDTRRQAITASIADMRASIQERPEFMVSLMAIDGAGPALSQDIREVVPLDFPVSSFDLDLTQIRKVISELHPVKSATVRVRPGGVLQIDVLERQPVLVWRNRNGIALLDDTGAFIDTLPSRVTRADLPLIVGEGAHHHVTQALALIAAARPLGDRLRGLVRIGARRWDVVLDRDQRILLPVDGAVHALERVIALSEAHEMLERDVAVIDMRLSARPTLRMSSDAVSDWWRIRELNGSGQ
ncbi:MAG: cell division protein FtsQ/DivIB [Sedimentitalea sp.]